MAKSRSRPKELRRRQKRRQTIHRLRVQYSRSKTITEKDRILAKLALLNPFLTKDEFLSPLNRLK